jgi:hypothetical protein
VSTASRVVIDPAQPLADSPRRHPQGRRVGGLGGGIDPQVLPQALLVLGVEPKRVWARQLEVELGTVDGVILQTGSGE